MHHRAFAAVTVVALLAHPAPAGPDEKKAADEVKALVNRGRELLKKLQPKAALEPLTKALATAEKHFGPSHPAAAFALEQIGRALVELGDFAKAERHYLRALEIRKVKYGQDDPTVARVHDLLGRLHADAGQGAKAESHFLRALTLYERDLARHAQDISTTRHDLAGVYANMGQHKRALALYRLSLEASERLFGPDHLDVAHTLYMLARLHDNLGNFAEAEPMLRRTLAIREKHYAADDPHIAFTLTALGDLYVSMGQYVKAEPLLTRGLAMLERKLGPREPSVARTLMQLANLYIKTGQDARSESCFRRAVAIDRERYGANHPGVVGHLDRLAYLAQRKGDVAEAARLRDQARRGSRHHVSVVLPSLPAAEQSMYLNETERWVFRASLSLALALRHRAETDLADRSAAWLLNGKAIAEEALAQSVLLTRASRDPATKALVGRLGEARAALAKLSMAGAGQGQEKSHRQRLDQLTLQEHELARQLAAAGGSDEGAPWFELDVVRKALPADGVFIDVARFETFDAKVVPQKQWGPARYAAWVVPPRGRVRLIDLGEAAVIDAAVVEVRKALEASTKMVQAKGEAEAEKALRGPLEKLSALVLKPLLPHVGTAKRWVVSPDAKLWLTPWETLLLADGKYAIERHEVSYVVSGRDLVTRQSYKGRPGQPVIVADPDFDMGAGPRLRNARPLPGTRDEAKAVEKRLRAFGKEAPALHLGQSAVEATVKAVKNPRVLVLATHGFFKAQPGEGLGAAIPSRPKEGPSPMWENPLLRCGLLLAGYNTGTSGQEDDGVLTGLEVLDMDLRGCEMVVLSACETGVGALQQGEGVAGLRQSFRLAGAESVVSTLWQVPDRSSAQLMAIFFQNLAKGKARPAALREAQLAVIADRRDDHAAAHPLFWAAFTLTGR